MGDHSSFYALTTTGVLNIKRVDNGGTANNFSSQHHTKPIEEYRERRSSLHQVVLQALILSFQQLFLRH